MVVGVEQIPFDQFEKISFDQFQALWFSSLWSFRTRSCVARRSLRRTRTWTTPSSTSRPSSGCTRTAKDTTLPKTSSSCRFVLRLLNNFCWDHFTIHFLNHFVICYQNIFCNFFYCATFECLFVFSVKLAFLIFDYIIVPIGCDSSDLDDKAWRLLQIEYLLFNNLNAPLKIYLSISGERRPE